MEYQVIKMINGRYYITCPFKFIDNLRTADLSKVDEVDFVVDNFDEKELLMNHEIVEYLHLKEIECFVETFCPRYSVEQL